MIMHLISPETCESKQSEVLQSLLQVPGFPQSSALSIWSWPPIPQTGTESAGIPQWDHQSFLRETSPQGLHGSQSRR